MLNSIISLLNLHFYLTSLMLFIKAGPNIDFKTTFTNFIYFKIWFLLESHSSLHLILPTHTFNRTPLESSVVIDDVGNTMSGDSISQSVIGN